MASGQTPASVEFASKPLAFRPSYLSGNRLFKTPVATATPRFAGVQHNHCQPRDPLATSVKKIIRVIEGQACTAC